MSRQTIKHARARATVQTTRNIRHGFPQRGRATLSGRGMALCLPLSVGHVPWGEWTA